jgi:hypothetical protein
MSIFSKHIEVCTKIGAPPDTVWNILTDFDSYHEWNPMLSEVRTSLEKGATVRFLAARPDGGQLKLKARITVKNEGSELVWKGGSDLLLSGEHYFRLHKLPDGGCRFEHGEHFRGSLLPFLAPKLRDAERVYQAMNEALRTRAESNQS